MNTVVQLPGTQPSIPDEGPVIDVDQNAIQRAAMTVFEEMVDGGCGLRDCIVAVYLAGQDSITGKPVVKRKKKPSIPPCPYDNIVALYHEQLGNLPKVQLMPAARKNAIRQFWVWIFESRRAADGKPRATDLLSGLAWVGLYFVKATENDFLMGRTKRSGEHANWKPDIDYVVSPRGMKQILEKTAEST
jgi:hypothetical protein